MARIVPIGIDFCASLRSPDLFDPAIMPVLETERDTNTEIKVIFH